MRDLFRISALITVTVLLGFNANIAAQDINTLPDDPRVKSGKTANGLGYIIIQNDAQKGLAHFSIAQKVGTSLESGNNIGSFLLLEQLATKGTRNFAGNSIGDYLKRIGVPSEKINFSTTPDRITYTIKDVPTERSNTVDSSLLILYNWMCAINIDEDDVAAEKNILRNRILSSQGRAENRLLAEQIGTLFPKSPYTNALNPENISSLNGLNTKDLRNFYYTWCRPDLQCVIVVGDVDAAKVETQIKSIFSTIPKPLKSEKRKYYSIPKNNGVRSIILKDKEFNKTTVQISLLKEPLKEAYKKTNIPYIQDYMDNAIFFLMQNRFRDGIVEKGLPIYDIELTKGNYLGIEGAPAYTLSFQTLPNSLYNSVSFVSSELKKIINSGFTKHEFNSTIDLYWTRLENGYDNRSTFANDIYLQRGLDSFYEGYSLASTEMNFEIMKEILYSLSLKDLNEYARLLLGQEGNTIICTKLPDIQEVKGISSERIKDSFANSLIANTANDSQHRISWPKVAIDAPAQIVEQEEDARSGEKVLKLSNGAAVVLKNTAGTGDTISFRAVSRGGFSLMDGVNIGNQDFFNDVLNISKIGDVGIADMKRLYAYNHLDVESRITQNTEELAGWGTMGSIDKLLEAIYLNFTQRSEDKSAYDIYSQRIKYYTQYKSISPDGIFSDSVNHYNNSNKKFTEALTTKEIDNYNYSRLHTQLSRRISNAADFTFIFAGEHIDDYTDQIVKYIGNIPSEKGKREDYTILPNYRSKGNINKRFFAKMRVPTSQANITYTTSCKPSDGQYLLSQVAKKYIENYVAEHFDKSITAYNIESYIEFYPENMFVLATNFESDSSGITKAINDTDALLRNIAAKNIDTKIWNKTILDIARIYKGERENVQETLDMLATKYLYNTDIYFELSDLQKLSSDNLATFIKELISEGNRICVAMDGTTADVETLRLLKENEFIREYFDIR